MLYSSTKSRFTQSNMIDGQRVVYHMTKRRKHQNTKNMYFVCTYVLFSSEADVGVDALGVSGEEAVADVQAPVCPLGGLAAVCWWAKGHRV